MSRVDRVKRQMLREVVRENVALRHPGPPKQLLPRYRYRRTALRLFAVIVVPAALFVSVNAISTSASGRSEVVVVPSRSVPTAAPAPAPAAAPVGNFAPTLFQLQVKTIVLDPGHGGSDPGAESTGGLSEKDVTLDVARKLKALLEREQYTVLMTRDEDRTLSLRERAEFANARKADLFVSIHLNAFPNAGRRGVETFVRGATNDPRVHELAGAENKGSGYTQADFKKLLEGVFADAQNVESRRLAGAVQGGLVSRLKIQNPALQDRGVKNAPLVVLIATEMPGILAEVSCLSHEEEVRLLRKDDYREKLAEALLTGVREYADARNRPRSAALGGT